MQVLQVVWHPNSQLLATVSTDRKCRVISATMPQVDKEPNSGPFSKPLPFGEVYPNAEFTCNSWTTAVAWSPSGVKLCFAGQDSSLTVVDFSCAEAPVVCSVKYGLLPLICLAFVGEHGVIGGGFDMKPILFAQQGAAQQTDW